MEKLLGNQDYLHHVVEASIYVGLIILLTAACFFILRPFLPLITWGVIIAIAVYPRYEQLQLGLGGRRMLSAILITVLLLVFLIVPTMLFAKVMVDGVQRLAVHAKEGSLTIPPAPANIESWPVIGVPLKNAWNLASANTAGALKSFTPQIKAIILWLASTSAEVGTAVLQFALSIVFAGVILANAPGAAGTTHSLAKRILGDKGPEFEQVAASTIRGVTTGILGVALIQSVLAGLGFLVAGLPGAGLWTIVFLAAAVLQVGALVLIPAVIYGFVIMSVTKAVIFLVWCVFVAVIDNILKPLLLGRGARVPIAVVFLGAIGGFVAMGILGLFVGAIVLSVGYKLFLIWLDRTFEVNDSEMNLRNNTLNVV